MNAPAAYKGILEPRRVYRNIKAASHLYLHDTFAPSQVDHNKHIGMVREASRFGFPFCVSARK